MSARDHGVTGLMEGLGMRVRTARVKQKLRLTDVAERSGYSASFLSQVERGIANPSVGALKHIADALSIPAMDLFFEESAGDIRTASEEALPVQAREAASVTPTVVRRDQRKAITYPRSSIRYELVVPHLRGALEVLWIEAPPGASTGEEYSHDAEECVLVIAGVVEITLGEERYELTAGDSIVFPGETPHGWRNHGDAAATLIWITTPPSF